MDAALDCSLPVAAQPSLDHVVDLAVRAESAGYSRIWLPETWGRDAVTTLTRIADETQTVGIGPGILNVYSRSPALIGQTAATLQEASDGRLRVGLGPSGPAVIENWHGVEFDRPLKRTRETIEVVRRVLSGEQVDYAGDTVDVRGFRLRCEPPAKRPPIDAAGMGPKSVELAGRFADGWHALLLTPEGIRDRLADLRRGAELADRDPDDLRVTLSLTCCALEDAARARSLARRHLAFYVGGMGTFYRDALTRQGYDVADEIHALWGSGDREGAIELVDDDLLDAVVAAGSVEHASERLRAFADVDGVDAVAVSFPRGADRGEQVATLENLAI